MPATLGVLNALRRTCTVAPPTTRERFTCGAPAVDDALGGGLMRGSLHEVVSAGADAPAAAGFVAGLMLRAAPGGRSMVWIRQSFAETETGGLYAPGLAELGLDPDALILVGARDAVAALRAGVEAVRCPALGAVVIETWGAPKVLDLTATRRLALITERSGVTAFLLRVGASGPSAALTRWSIAAGPSPALAAGAPGQPTLDIALLRHRAGIAGTRWRVEWDRDRRLFRESAPLSGAVVPVPARRPAAPFQRLARTG
jgi:protein ImuA